MRNLTAALTLSLIFSVSAFAAEETQKIARPEPVPGSTSTFSEPNMKKPKDSGGKTTSPMILEAPIQGDYVMGNPKAKLIMVEYASMSCPHCAHFTNVILPDLKKNYIDTGKMRYILRQFPLNEPALKAAMLLDCVGEQNNDKYYVFAKVLFDAQSKWAFDTNFMSGLETIASVGGLTKEQFNSCTAASNDREMKVLKQKKLAGDELRIPHTPYIFIGDEVFDGDRSYEIMSKFIDKKLAEISKPADK